MGPIKFQCSICLEDRRERAPRLIDGSHICIGCVEEHIVPSFENALQYEHDYPPKWGPIELNVADFEGMLREHFGQDFLDRYSRRETEHIAKDRVYCHHQIDSQHAPKTGGICPSDSKLALTPDMIETYNAAGRTQVKCGGFVTEGPKPPGTIMQCSRCNGRICAACETLIHSVKDELHVCNPGGSADDLQDPYAQIRGRDIQHCPNRDCCNTIALLSGCNHITCNLCKTNFCFICGVEANANSGHWNPGNSCPRYNQPAPNAQQDELPDVEDRGDELDFDDPEWGELMSRIRFVAMYRLEDGVPIIEQEWLHQVLARVLPGTADLELERLTTRMFAAFTEVRPRPPMIRGWPTPILSPEGLDEVAMRAAERVLDHGPHSLTRAWVRQVMGDMHVRAMEHLEFEDVCERLMPTLRSVVTSYFQGLFNINAVNATPEINEWARINGFELDEEPVVQLLRLYDDVSANLELAEVAVPDEDQVRDFRQRHDAIFRVSGLVVAELDIGTLGELANLLEIYAERAPDWL